MGHVQLVTYLLDNAAASVATRTLRGETALHVAARSCQTDVIRVLLRHAADVNAAAKVSSLMLVGSLETGRRSVDTCYSRWLSFVTFHLWVGMVWWLEGVAQSGVVSAEPYE